MSVIGDSRRPARLRSGRRFSLRLKILIGLAATLAVGIGLLYVAGSALMMDGFLKLERSAASEDVGRASDAVAQQLASIDTTITTFSSWDDTYAWIEDHNQAYADSNLGDSVFEQLDASFIAFVAADGKTVWARWSTPGSGTATDQLPPAVQALIATGSPLLATSATDVSVEGIGKLQDGPILAVSRAILTSDGTGPSRGTMVMGRLLDAAAVGKLSALTHQELTIWPLDGTGAPSDVTIAARALKPDSPVSSAPLDEHSIAAYRLLDDLNGRPAYVLRSLLPREVYAQGGRTLETFVALLPLLGLAVVLVLMLLLDRLVLRGLRKLTTVAERVALGDVSVHVEETGRTDEVGAVARAFEQTVGYLRAAAGAADRVAEGDLTEQVTPRSADDALGIALRRMVDNLHGLLGRVTDTTDEVKRVAVGLSASANEVREATEQVAQTVSQVASGAQEQSRGVGDTSASMAQLDALIGQVKTGASDTAGRADAAETALRDLANAIAETLEASGHVERVSASATQAAAGGSDAVRESVAGMSRIDAVVRNASVKVSELGAKGQQIGVIVEKIGEIADQTNLLALNAAIEAARAGAQGKGFAVVADEVRKLAEKSSSATKEIAALVGEVRRGTEEAVAAMAAGGDEVERGSALAAHSGQAIDELGAAVEATRSAAEGIGRTVEAMSAAARGVFAAIEEIGRIAQENRSGAEAMTEQSGNVTDSLGSIAAVSEENSAAAQEVAAATEEMSAQAREFVDSAEALVASAEQLAAYASQFRLAEEPPANGGTIRVADAPRPGRARRAA